MTFDEEAVSTRDFKSIFFGLQYKRQGHIQIKYRKVTYFNHRSHGLMFPETSDRLFRLIQSFNNDSVLTGIKRLILLQTDLNVSNCRGRNGISCGDIDKMMNVRTTTTTNKQSKQQFLRCTIAQFLMFSYLSHWLQILTRRRLLI